MLLESPLQLRTVIFVNGERYPVLVSKEDGIPLFTPTVYITSMLRSRGNQATTLAANLEAIKFLYDWACRRNIDIETRFGNGEFLSVPEIESLTNEAKCRASDLLATSRSQMVNKKTSSKRVIRVRRFGRLKHINDERSVKAGTTAFRLIYINC